MRHDSCRANTAERSSPKLYARALLTRKAFGVLADAGANFIDALCNCPRVADPSALWHSHPMCNEHAEMVELIYNLLKSRTSSERGVGDNDKSLCLRIS